MLNYIRIFGTREQLLTLPRLSGMEVRPRTANQLEDGSWEVYAYATDADLIELGNQGFDFDIRVSSSDQGDHLARLDNFIGENNQGIG